MEERKNINEKKEKTNTFARVGGTALRKADYLFVGGSREHKQVETNNILAALRERVDDDTGELSVCSWGDSLLNCHSCPRATVTRRTSDARLVINAGLRPTRRSLRFHVRYYNLTYISLMV